MLVEGREDRIEWALSATRLTQLLGLSPEESFYLLSESPPVDSCRCRDYVHQRLRPSILGSNGSTIWRDYSLPSTSSGTEGQS